MNKLFLLAAAVLSVVTLRADEQADIFYRTIKHLDRGGILFQFHNTQNLDKQFEKIITLGAQNSNTAHLQLGLEFIKLLSKTVDLKSLQGIGASVKDLNPYRLQAFALYQNKSFVAIDPKSSGSVFAVVKNANGKFPSAANLPLNTIFATGIKLNWSNAYTGINKKLSKENSARSIFEMIEQNLGVKMPDLMKNISGDYFFAVYKDKKPDSFHFLAQIPDNNSVLKNLAKQKMAPLMKLYKDQSASFELPLPQGKFGVAYTVLFAQNNVFIYNSNAPLSQLLNVKKQEKLLSSLAPQIFGFLNKCEGNSYAVINLNTADIAPDLPKQQYLAGTSGVMTHEGYLQSGKSNFMIFDFSEYLPLLDILTNLRDPAQDSPLTKALQ